MSFVRRVSELSPFARNFALSSLLLVGGAVAHSTATGRDDCLQCAHEVSEIYDMFFVSAFGPKVFQAPGFDPDRHTKVLRVGATQFFSTKIAHLSFEIANIDEHGIFMPSEVQVHGVIIDGKTGETLGMTPCNLEWVGSQRLLQGVVSNKDLNRAMLDRTPSVYFELKYMDDDEARRVVEKIEKFVNQFNQMSIEYGFIVAPNSNTLVHGLLNHLHLEIPEEHLAALWLPGFRDKLPEMVLASNAP